MKKQLKRIVAIVAAIAMTVTGMTFTPSKVSAATKTVTATAGGSAAEGTEGLWQYTVIPGDSGQYQWNVSATFGDCDSIDGFTATLSDYCWDGSYWKASDLKSVYGLTAGVSYNCVITISETPSGSTHTPINVRTTGGTTNISPQSQTSTGTSMTWTGTVVPSNSALVLAIGYGNNGQGGSQGGQAGSFTVESVVFTPTETTTNLYDWQHCPDDNTNFVPEDGSLWTLRSNKTGGSWGNQYYKMDSSKQVSDVSRTHLKKAYTEALSDWWWDSASLLGYGTTIGLTNGEKYTGSIVINSSAATAASYTWEDDQHQSHTKVPKLKVIVFGEEYETALGVGDTTLTINEFKYNPGANDNIQFVFTELPEDAEFYIKSVNFTSIYDNWTKAPVGTNQTVTGSSVWKTSVSYDGSDSYGDIRYKNSSAANNDPSKTTFKMAGAIGEAEVYGQDAPSGKQPGDRIDNPSDRWWWMSADLTGNYLITLDTESGKSGNTTGGINDTLTENKKYNISIDYDSTAATVDPDDHGYAAKLFVTPEGGSEESFDLVSGSGTLELEQEVVYNGTSENLKFLFDELTEDSELNITGVTFTEIDDGWVKVPTNVEGGTQPEQNSAWRLISNNVPDPDKTYGNSWYKIYDDAENNVARIHLKKEYADTGVENEWNWDMAKYTVSTTEDSDCTLVPKHHYTGQIVIKSTAGTNTGKVLGLEVFGETYDTALSSSGTTTVNISDFKYDPSTTDILLRFAELPQSAEFYIDSISFTNNDDGWAKVPTNEENGDTDGNPIANTPWTLFSTNNSSTVTVNPTNGDSWYKLDNSASGLSRVHLKKDYTDSGMENGWYWDYARVAVTTNGFNIPLVDKHHYTGTIRIHSSAATSSGHTLRVVAFGQTIEAALNNGSTDINIADFKFDPANHTNIEFVYVELPRNAEWYVENITFTNNDNGWTKVPINVTGGTAPETNSPWSLVSNNDTATAQNGDSWYKLDTTKPVTDISRVHLKKDYTDANMDNEWGWDSAKLSVPANTYGLVDKHHYTGTLLIHSSAATASGKHMLVNVFGTEYEVSLVNGTATVNIADFKYNATNNTSIDFTYVEIPQNAEWYVESLTFSSNDDGWIKVPTNEENGHTNGNPIANTPWTLFSTNNSATVTEGASNGDSWYKLDNSASGLSRVHLKKDYTDSGMDNAWYWDSAKLVAYGTSNGLVDGESYTGSMVINSSAATTGNHKIKVVVFGNTYDVPLNSGDTTIAIEQFKFNSAANNDIAISYVEIPQNAEIYVKSIDFDQVDGDFTKAEVGDNNVPNTNWRTSVNNNPPSSYGDIRYKVDSTLDSNDPANTMFKMAGSVGEAETYGENPPSGKQEGDRIDNPADRWWWISAELYGDYEASVTNSDSTTDEGNITDILEKYRTYTAQVVVNSTAATAEGTTDEFDAKLFVTLDGTEQAFKLSSGDNTLTLSTPFVFDGESADIKFLFDELAADSKVYVKSISFTQLDDGWRKVITDEERGDSDGNAISGTPWTLFSTNDSQTVPTPAEPTNGDSWYMLDTTSGVSALSKVHMKKTYSDAGMVNSWWWDSAKLVGYGTSNGLVDGETYTGSIVINSSVATTGNHTIKVVVFGETYDVPLSNGDTTIAIDAFKFNSGVNNNIEFSYVELPANAEWYVKSIDFTNVNYGWNKVTQSTQVDPSTGEVIVVDDNPTGSAWTFNATYIPPSQYGDIRYKVEDSTVGGTLIKPYGVPESAHYYWTKAKLEDYLESAPVTDMSGDPATGLEDGKTYTGTITFKYKPVDATKNPELRYLIPGAGIAEEDYVIDTSNGTYNPSDGTYTYTIEIPEFDYNENSDGTITFELDKLEALSELQVTDISFTMTDDWTHVPEVPEGVQYGARIPVNYGSAGHYHNWDLFNGWWGGEGCKLYHDNDIPDYTDPLRVKIGDGNRGDPSCAQVKVENPDAYKDLEDYHNYYMTLRFKSTAAGTIHINQEGYTPTELQRFEVHQTTGANDWNEYKKIFTYMPENNYDGSKVNNLVMFLTASTYIEGGTVVPDGTPLPVGTILSDFEIIFSRVDDDGWTLVTDSRHESVQGYDDIVEDSSDNPILQAYANSYYDGRLSYKANYNASGEDDIAKMGIRVDLSSGDFGDVTSPYQSWPAHLRIPNSYFYNRTDTKGHELVDGNKYKLRFYYNAELPEGSSIPQGKGLVMVRQGYDNNVPSRYQAHAGLNMCNGTISDKSGYNSHSDDDYNKSGGIDITYDASKTTTTEQYNTHVQFDFSEFPAGTKISDISWEFVAKAYDVYIDGNKNTENPITEGQTYTFPTNETQGFENVAYFEDSDGNHYAPGSTVPFNTFDQIIEGDLYVTAVRNHTVTIVDADHPSVEIQTASVEHGSNYTLPTITGVESYTYDNVNYEPGDPIGPIEDDETVYAHLAQNTHTVVILNADGTNYSTTVVADGGSFTFPSGQDLDNIKNYVNTSDPTDTKTKGTQITVTSDLTYQMVPYNYYTITIDGVVDQTVREDESYTWPAGDHVIRYSDKDVTASYTPGTSFTPARNYDVTSVKAYTVTIVDPDDHTNVLYQSEPIESGQSFSFSTTGLSNIKQYVGVEGTSGSYGPTGSVDIGNADLTYEAVPYQFYTITIDGVVDQTVREDQTYTWPTGSHIVGYDDKDTGERHDPGDTITPDRDYDVTTVKAYSITIIDEDGNELYSEDDIEAPTEFKLFDNTDQGFENIDHYEGVEGVTGDFEPGDYVDIVDADVVVKAIFEEPAITYEWRVDGVKQADVEAGTEITLPSTATVGYLLEYTDGQDQGATDDLYKPASTYVVNRNVNFISINSVALNPTPGAAMRFEGDSSETAKDARGIAFAATLTVNGGTNENILSSDAFQTGMIITSLDAFTDIFEEDITIEKVAADTTGSAVDIQNTGKDAEKWTTGQPGNYRCGITHMKDANIARDFVARGYTKITFVDGSTYDTIYADNPSSQTARNIKQIATLIYTEHYDYYATLPKAWQEMVLECMEH